MLQDNGIVLSDQDLSISEVDSPQKQSKIHFKFVTGGVVDDNWEMFALVVNAYIMSRPDVILTGFNENDEILSPFEEKQHLELYSHFGKWINKDRDVISFRYSIELQPSGIDFLYLKIIKSEGSSLNLYFMSELKWDAIK